MLIGVVVAGGFGETAVDLNFGRRELDVVLSHGMIDIK